MFLLDPPALTCDTETLLSYYQNLNYCIGKDWLRQPLLGRKLLFVIIASRGQEARAQQPGRDGSREDLRREGF